MLRQTEDEGFLTPKSNEAYEKHAEEAKPTSAKQPSLEEHARKEGNPPGETSAWSLSKNREDQKQLQFKEQSEALLL